jgi:hypothetical protein
LISLKAVELGMPSSFAIARPVKPLRPQSLHILAMRIQSRRTPKVDSSPPRLVQACMDCLDGNRTFELTDSIEHVENCFTRHFGSINARAWNKSKQSSGREIP